MSNFFSDILERAKLIPELVSTGVKTAKSKATAYNLENELRASLAKKATPTTTVKTGFFTDIIKNISDVKPATFVTENSKVIKASAAFREEMKKITESVIKELPFVGERLSATPEQEEAIKEKYKVYTFKDAAKDVANLGLEFTVNPLLRIGLTGNEIITGEKLGVGAGVGFNDAKTFAPSIIGSLPAVYKYNKESGDSTVVAGLRTGVTFAFDLLLGFGMAEQGLPSVRLAARRLPESLLFRIKTEKIPVDEVIGSLVGSNPTPRGTAFIQSLSNKERVAIFNVARAYESAGGRPIEIIEKTPTKLGEFARLEARRPTPVEIRDERQLPGTALVGKPQPAFGLSIQPVKKVGGTPEVSDNLLQEAKWKEANKIETGGIPGVRGLKKVGMAPEPPVKITKTETQLLKSKLRSQAKGATIAVAEYKKSQAILERTSKELQAEINKPKGKQRSVIYFIKQLGEFNQTAMNEIKTELGIEKPLKQMSLTELKDFTIKLKERLKFKFERGYVPSVETKEKLNLKETPKPTLNEVDYEKNRQLVKETRPTMGKEITKIGQKTTEAGGKILVLIPTRLGNIDPSLKYAMRKFEYDAMGSVQKGKKAIEPYLVKTKVGLFRKMTKDDFADLDLALKNGDSAKISEINKKYGIEKEFEEVRKTLDDIYKRANKVGFDIGYQKDYWPRVIKDTEGFLEYFGKQDYWSILDEAIKRKEMDLGRYLLPEEKANLINTMIRGYQGGQITLSGTGAMKGRVIDLVTPELNKFYYNSPTSLVKYIEEVNDKIAARKFFGKGNKLEGFNNVEDSIGTYTADLLAKGKITPKQELELRDMLNARFNPKGTHGVVGLYKNLAYMDVMGSFLNAVTQLGDQSWAIYRGGLWGTIKADVKSAFGKSEITKETLGIEANSIAQEFSDAGGMAKAVDKLFTLTGLNKIDRLGKEALINVAIEKYRNLANKPTADFLKKIDDIFGEESGQVLDDLKSGELTENVKLLAFNELLDFHPVALSEMPEVYLKAGNGRIFYMLKSYTLKQFDIFRREAFDEMKKGNWWKGIRNLLSLATLVILTNGTADEIKDLLTNRKTKLSDRVIDQLAMLAGFSRYSFGKISEVGLGSALIEQITPPTNFIDNISKDILNLYKDFDKSADINQLRTVQDIPLVGKFYYWWFGKGKEITGKYNKPKESIGGLKFNFGKQNIQGISPVEFNFEKK